MIGLVQIGSHSMADRYTYVPILGIFIAVVWGAADLAEHWPATRAGFGLASVAALVACAVLARGQLRYWHDTRSLFEHALAVTRDNALAENDLGVCLLDAGDLTSAEPHFATAVRLQSNYCAAVVNLGVCRAQEGKLPEAIALLERAVRLEPTSLNHYNLARVLLEAGDSHEGESHLRMAVELDPNNFQAWHNLGVLMSKQHKTAEATLAFTAALRRQPAMPATHLEFGKLLVEQQEWDAAIEQLQIGLAAIPGDVQGHRELGVALFSRGRSAEAVQELETALLGSSDARTHYYLGLLLHSLGRFSEALPHYQQAVRFDPDTPDYANDLAWLLATCPEDGVRDGKEAVRLAQAVCHLSGGKEARFWGTLDAAYAEAGRFEEAVEAAKKAQELALAAGQADLARAAGERLAAYAGHKPYRQHF